jgi:retinol dehydrogenase 12
MQLITSFDSRYLGKPFLWVFFKTPKNGAQTQIRLAVDPELQDVSGKYFSDCKEKATSTKGRDDEMAEWLWKESERLVGLVKTENQV